MHTFLDFFNKPTPEMASKRKALFAELEKIELTERPDGSFEWEFEPDKERGGCVGCYMLSFAPL